MYLVSCVPAGSPFLVKVVGEGTGLASASKHRQQNAADVTHIGSECELSLKIPSTLFVLYDIH
jgi:filamin